MTITVDAEFELEDYFPQILRLITQSVKNNGFNDGQMKALQEAMNIPDPPELKIKNLPDKMKFEHLCKVWDKYTLDQLEILLPD